MIKLRDIVLDILFPRFCVGCAEEGRYLCESCTLFVSEVDFSCPVCDKPEFFGKRHEKCREDGSPDGGISFWSYEGLIKQMILRTKYRCLIDIPRELIDYGLLSIQESEYRFSEFTKFLFDKKTVLSYVPLHKEREKRRGFDQAKVAAEHLAKRAGKRVIPLLKRNKETKPQTELQSKEERFLNTENTFSFLYGKKPEQVVLVDDVLTSGATTKECTKALKRKGVKRVWLLTLAKTI